MLLLVSDYKFFSLQVKNIITKQQNMSKKILVSVCAFLMTIMVGFSQTVTVTGKVIDEKNTPVAGASVLDKGSKKGVSAGTDGTFSISVKKGSTLVVSALGFESKEVAALNNVTVQLVSDVKALADVVVTGVGACNF
jgi:hypothetical protein